MENRILLQNIPGNAQWEESFYGKLSEYGVWDFDAFWLLQRQLINISKEQFEPGEVNELCFMILFLQQRIDSLFIAHYDESDVYKIENIEEPYMLYDLKEVLDMALLCAISKEEYPESAFEIKDPMLLS